MTKQKEWACSHNCDLSKGTCEHLEALLPQMNDGDHPQYLSDGAMNSMTVNVFHVQFPHFDKSRFQELMRNYGFVDSWDINLLTAKYVDGLSDQAIFESFHYASRRTLNRRLKALRALLKERGFEQEIWSWEPEPRNGNEKT